MGTDVIVKIRTWFRLIIGSVFVGSLYLMFFDDVFMKEFSEEFSFLLLPQVVYCLVCCLIFVSLFFCFRFTKEGFQCGFKFGPKTFFIPKHRVVAWEIIQVYGIFPFYTMDNIVRAHIRVHFLFHANFLDLIIFVDENVSCGKMDPDDRENFRRLADKFRKLKKDHKIIYWLLNNL